MAAATVVRTSLALGLALGLLAAAAWGQTGDPSTTGLFRVDWAPRRYGMAPAIEGRVHNDSPYRVTNVRLRVEGLDADSHPVGQRFAWALGDIAPGGQTSFVIETMPGAITYRIAVDSYDILSIQAP